jgi:hypothetical protein
MDLHSYYAFVDILVDSISNSAEYTYIGMEYLIQPDRQNREKEFPEGWTFTAITSK